MYTAMYELDEMPPPLTSEPGRVVELRIGMHRFDAQAGHLGQTWPDLGP